MANNKSSEKSVVNHKISRPLDRDPHYFHRGPHDFDRAVATSERADYQIVVSQEIEIGIYYCTQIKAINHSTSGPEISDHDQFNQK
jgi:hypothetical protein